MFVQYYVVTPFFIKKRRAWGGRLLSYPMVGMGVEYPISPVFAISSEGARYVTVLLGPKRLPSVFLTSVRR